MPATKTKPKHFGTKKTTAAAPPIEFTIDFLRDGEVETHAFTARPDMSYGDTIGLVMHQDDSSGLLPYFDRFIRRSLVNNDGVPAKWTPTVVEGHFTAPNGDHTPVDQLEKFTAPEAGSSRRRWLHLMDPENDELTVELEQVMAVFEYLIGQAGGDRPT